MSEYSFEIPILKGSRRKIDIINAEKQRVGTIQRFYKNKLKFLIDNILDQFFVNVEVFNTEGHSMIKATEVISLETLVQSQWDVQSCSDDIFNIKDRTKIKTNPVLEFKTTESIYKLQKGFADKRFRVLNPNAEVIAEITYDKLLPPRTITIRILKAEINVFTIACIYYIFTLRD